MKPRKIALNKGFIGRTFELQKLSQISDLHEASIVVVYGRRRVGKTELIEQAFRTRNILKFEGIEGQSEKDQIKSVLLQLSDYAQDPLIARLDIHNWTEVFKLMAGYTAKGRWTIFLDELQWMASYNGKLVSELKYVWDNYFRYNKSLILILCGSSPSFIINKVLKSKALYNRSQHEIHLHEFSLPEMKSFLSKGRSNREIMDAYLSVGGVPEYLRYLDHESSVFLGLCKNSFTTGSFFSNEYQRIFVSSLRSNENYLKIIKFLSKRKFVTRSEIAKHIKCESGGSLTMLLEDLELCGFINKYSPFNLSEKSLLTRYNISDQYLQFWFKFIEPIYSEIQDGSFNQNPASCLKADVFNKWFGFSFERFCRKHHRMLARLLGFESVEYRAGTFFNRQTDRMQKGFQIDLIYDRADNVYTVCEMKYLQSKATPKVITEFERKLELFPNPGNHTIHKVLITTEGADKVLTGRRYFDRVVTLDEILDS